MLAALGTDGANYGLGPKSIRTWLRKMEKRNPFVLTGASQDYLEGRFREPVRNARGLAEKMYRFCPDIVEQGCGSLDALAREMQRTQQFLFWWD